MKTYSQKFVFELPTRGKDLECTRTHAAQHTRSVSLKHSSAYMCANGELSTNSKSQR